MGFLQTWFGKKKQQDKVAREGAKRSAIQGDDVRSSKGTVENDKFHRAIMAGRLSEVDSMLKHDPKLISNADATYLTSPLHRAAQYNQFNIARLLLKNNADVNARDKDGKTPLDLAKSYGYGELAQLFIQHGRKGDKPAATSASPFIGETIDIETSMRDVDFALFFFNSDNEAITGNYAVHAKDSICSRVAERDPRVRSLGWHVISGDLLGLGNLKTLLHTSAVSPDGSQLDSSFLNSVEAGGRLGFVPYVVGLFACPTDAMRHADLRLKQDEVAGYLGSAFFTLPNEKALQEISEGLGLPMTSLHSIA